MQSRDPCQAEKNDFHKARAINHAAIRNAVAQPKKQQRMLDAIRALLACRKEHPRDQTRRH